MSEFDEFMQWYEWFKAKKKKANHIYNGKTIINVIYSDGSQYHYTNKLELINDLLDELDLNDRISITLERRKQCLPLTSW